MNANTKAPRRPWLLFPSVTALLLVTASARPCLADDFATDIRPLLAEFCVRCHSGEKPKGDLDLEAFDSFDAVKRRPQVWQKVLEQLRDGQMPPEEKRQPSAGQKARLTAWVRGTLDAVARERAGDPGRVVLRRLSNAEYTYTLRDLTGVESLDPAREFPADGAAGEGFTNTGQALVMSPALVTKYLDAGKDVAAHLVLLPDGVRFSSKTTRRDWTNEILDEIRALYGEYTDAGGGERVNLQGIAFNTNEGGLLPLERYLRAAIELRDGGKDLNVVAAERHLSPKYLATLMSALNGREPSPLLDGLRSRYRTARPEDAAALAAEIAPWQRALWKFGSVGHIGKLNGPKVWMEPVSPLAERQEFKVKLAAPSSGGNEIVVYLAAGDAGDGNANDFAVWRQPRLVVPGRPPLLLRDARAFVRDATTRRERLFASAARALAAADEAAAAKGDIDLPALARRHELDADALAAWFDYLGVGATDGPKLDYLRDRIAKAGQYDFISGWGSDATPSVLANASDQLVRIPGNAKPHGVVVHPSPKLQVAVGWHSPVSAAVRIEGVVTHAHPGCGNGVAWSLERRRGRTRQRLAGGVVPVGQAVPFGPIENLAVQSGDLISLLIDPRDGNHVCDLTDLEFKVSTTTAAAAAGGAPREWSLTRDVAGDVTAGNPHADRLGNAGVWHFYAEPTGGGGDKGAPIPDGSLLAKWLSASDAAEKARLADAVQKLLTSPAPEPGNSPDALLYAQLHSMSGPLAAAIRQPAGDHLAAPADPAAGQWALDPALLGRHPDGSARDAADLCVKAPSVIEVRLPADLFAGGELVTTGTLDEKTGAGGSVQLQVLTSKPESRPGQIAGSMTAGDANIAGTSSNTTNIWNAAPIIAVTGSVAWKRTEAAFDEFRRVFPAALCYTKIVPVDEVVTLTLFYREDDRLADLMLDDAQRARLDRLWGELRFVSQDALSLVDAFEQIWQYATQDADPKVFEPMRRPIYERAAAFRRQLVEAEPRHVEAVIALAERAYRRPLTDQERDDLQRLYRKLRDEELPHEQAVRLLLARVLVAPAFLYRAEQPGPSGVRQAPVNDFELATRLSYFLWSSLPDADLRAAAAAGRLRDPDVLAAEARRMIADPRARRLATEFACQWLHVYGFDALDEKSERHFPTFAALRGAMYEETVLFLTDLFARDRPLLDVLDADYTFLNEDLAKHYGIPGVAGPQWRRVGGVKQYGRGGVLAQATTLAKQSGASRTSPILRGNWVAEVLLGERLPRPPKDVPKLPEDEPTDGLTMRQLTERHTADPRCASCHARIDPFGYTLEAFDAIGRLREKGASAGTRAEDTRAMAPDGTTLDGIDGLRHYLLTKRRDAFVRQFCRKLLGYALGRAVQLSDEPLLDEMQAKLAAGEYHVGIAVETVVRSRQFREIRGRDVAFDE